MGICKGCFLGGGGEDVETKGNGIYEKNKVSGQRGAGGGSGGAIAASARLS